MATFYLLPARPVFDDAVAKFIGSWFPGQSLPSTRATELSSMLQDSLDRKDVYVVFREELPEGSDPALALRDGFGAESGDDVVEMRLVGSTGEVQAKSWRISGMSAA